MHVFPFRRAAVCLQLTAWVACAAFSAAAWGQTVRHVTNLPLKDERPHPLDSVLRFTQQEFAYLQRTVHDYTCRIVKRERVNGALQEHQYLRAWVRPASLEAGPAAHPFAVLLDFQAPRKVAGRRVLFVEGMYEGKMLVRQRAGGMTFRVSPEGGLAARESAMPITSIGFHNMLREAMRQMEDDIAADPLGANTRVDLFKNAKIDNRACTAIRITHPRRQEGLDFHMAHVFLDEQWRLPVRLDFYDWPATEGGEPALLGEYTYQDVKINVGLSDADFDHRRLGLHYSE